MQTTLELVQQAVTTDLLVLSTTPSVPPSGIECNPRIYMNTVTHGRLTSKAFIDMSNYAESCIHAIPTHVCTYSCVLGVLRRATEVLTHGEIWLSFK